MAEVRAAISQRLAMTFDLQKMIESKRAYRVRLAALPIGEKLRILDALCERQRSIRGNTIGSDATVLHGELDTYERRKP